MFEHDSEQLKDRPSVGQQGDNYRESMRGFSSSEQFYDLPSVQRWNEAACILIRANAVIADRGRGHRALHEIPGDDETAFVIGENLSNFGTVTDVRAGFYPEQASETEQSVSYFGKDNSIMVYARERVPGARGKGTKGPWHPKGWIGFELEPVSDITSETDDRFGSPYVVLLQQGVEERLSVDDSRANDIVGSVGETAMACLNFGLIRSKEMGAQTLRVISEQVA